MASFASFLSNHKAGAASPLVMLAPMSGITDVGMRRAAQHFGASFVVSEMVDATFYASGEPESRMKAEGQGIACHIVQIAGCRADSLAQAARLAEAAGAAVVDINMGCPAKKVVGGLAGSALMRDLDHATRLIRETRAAVSVPVTVKMRLGWDETSRNAPELARRAEAEGVALVTVHGRTRCQFYNGAADWPAIRSVKEAVSIPVVANGDCHGAADARAMLAASGADGVMIGRAAIGRPWLVGEVAAALGAGAPTTAMSPSAKREAAIAHYRTIIDLFGPAKGVRHARKHLAGYALHAGFPATSPAHQALVTANEPEHVVDALSFMFDHSVSEIAA